MDTHHDTRRSSDGNRTLPAWLICILVVTACFLILFPRASFQRQAIFPGDLQYFYEPWHSEFNTGSAQASNWILFDEVLEFHPWREYMRRNLLQGIIPLWDATAFCGYPFGGLFQTALLYPPDRMLDLLPFGPFTVLRAYIHLLLAALGTFWYLRHQKFSAYAAILGGIGYGFCGFMIVWLGHPHIKPAAWMPWLFLAVEHAVQRRRGGVTGVTGAAVMVLCAGHIETALHVITVAGIYGIVRAFQSFGFRGVIRTLMKRLIPGAVLAVLITSAMALPFAEYLFRSVAYATRADGVVVQPFLDKILLFTHLMPKLFGSSADGDYWYRGFNSAELGGGFAGTSMAVMALAGLLIAGKWRAARAHWTVVVFSVGVAYHVPLIYQAAEWIPGYKMSYNFRLVLPMAFSVVVLAAYWADHVGSPSRRWIHSLYVVTGILTAAVLSPLFWLHRIPSANPPPSNPATLPVITALIPLILLLFLGTARYRTWIRRPVFMVCLTAVAAGELLLFGAGYNPQVPPETISQLPESAEFLRVTPHTGPFRVIPLGYMYPPHTCLRFNMHDIRGNDALTPRRVEDYVALAQPAIRGGHMLPALRMMWLTDYRSPFWNMVNVQYFLFPAGRGPTPGTPLRFHRRAGTVDIYRNPDALARMYLATDWTAVAPGIQVLDRIRKNPEAHWVEPAGELPEPVPDSSGTVSIHSYTPHRITADLSTSRGGLAVISDTWFPGWVARVDTEPVPIHCVNHAFRGVWVPPGQHRIQMDYRPVSFLLGGYLTLLGLAILAAVRTGLFARLRFTSCGDMMEKCL